MVMLVIRVKTATENWLIIYPITVQVATQNADIFHKVLPVASLHLPRNTGGGRPSSLAALDCDSWVSAPKCTMVRTFTLFSNSFLSFFLI